MTAWETFRTKYALEAEDLPDQRGINVVVIEAVDNDVWEGPGGSSRARRGRLWFAGWNYPLPLNNARVDILRQLFGNDSNAAIGRKLGLEVVPVREYDGSYKGMLYIASELPGDHEVPARVPARWATRSNQRLEAALKQGVIIERMVTPAKAPAKVVGTGVPLGEEAAAKMMCLIQERSRDWGFVVGHLSRAGLSDLVDAECPPGCDAAIREPLWTGLLCHLPITSRIEDRDALARKYIAGWASRAPGPVEPATGEVLADLTRVPHSASAPSSPPATPATPAPTVRELKPGDEGYIAPEDIPF